MLEFKVPYIYTYKRDYTTYFNPEVPYIYTYKRDYITYFNPEDMYRSPTTQFLIPSPSYIIFPCSRLNPLRSSLCTFLSDEYKASPKI